MTAEILARFHDSFAYCGKNPEVEDHLVPRNRTSGGLHAGGNVVPSCRACNRPKSGRPWREHLASLDLDPDVKAATRAPIEQFVTNYQYEPDMQTLLPVLAGLFILADRQARGLVEFAVAATEPHLSAMRVAPPALPADGDVSEKDAPTPINGD